MSFGIGGSSSSSTSLSQQTSIATSTAGASSPAASGAGAVIGAGKTLSGSNDNSGQSGLAISGAGNVLNASTNNTFGNGTVFNADPMPAVNAALQSLGTALTTAVANRDVISPTPNATVTQTGTMTPASGMLSAATTGATSILSTPAVKIAMLVSFPLLFLLAWYLFKKGKK